MPTSRERLYILLVTHPYLELAHHQLHESVEDVRKAIESGSGDPEDMLDRIEFELESEEKTLAAAYKRFDNTGRGKLDRGDMKTMSAYLGFPHQDSDIDKLMKAIDTDATGFISFREFCQYVGRMGGSMKLFEERRKVIAERGGFTEGEAAEDLKLSLKESGIDDDAQAYWRLVVSPSEFRAAGSLVKCQKHALTHIRSLAKKNHQDALPKVQKRVLGMGFKDENLWMALAWIRELAPIIVHVNIDKMLQFMEKDTHYRNQFETKTSGGLLKPEVRTKWEKDLFGGCYDKAKAFDRCKYGVQNVMNDYRGVVKCAQYGDSYLVLKDVRLRCTFSPEDSANLKADRLAVLDFYAHVLNEYSDVELKETLNVANSKDAAMLGDSSRVGSMKYKEAQIHGEVRFDSHIERLVAHTRHRKPGQDDRIKQVCKKFNWAFSWMDEEQARMKREDMHKMAGSTWEDRLSTLENSDLKVEVPAGYCRMGCGRKVNPGTTRAGRPFTTCCKGCIMGFGHDTHCGKIDESKVGPGKCKNGCGRPVALGRDSKGRPLDTCCRGCALGLGHDATCGKKSGPIAAGMCIKGCGRPVAEGETANGKPFTTCCRGCAMGKGHSPECKPCTPTSMSGMLGISSPSSRQNSQQDRYKEPQPFCPPVTAGASEPDPAPASGGSCCAIL